MATRFAIQVADCVPQRQEPPDRLYEDDLRTYLAWALLGAGHLVRTPGTASHAPDLVVAEALGVQVKFSLSKPPDARIALAKAQHDFDWFLGRPGRAWPGAKVWLVFWSGQETFRRVRSYNHVVKAENVGGGPYNMGYPQQLLEPFIGYVRQNASSKLMFRTDLSNDTFLPVQVGADRYVIQVVGSPADPMWATIYWPDRPTPLASTKPLVVGDLTALFAALGRP